MFYFEVDVLLSHMCYVTKQYSSLMRVTKGWSRLKVLFVPKFGTLGLTETFKFKFKFSFISHYPSHIQN